MHDDDEESWKRKALPHRPDVNLTAEEIVAYIERLDASWEAANRLWQKILKDLRHPWRDKE